MDVKINLKDSDIPRKWYNLAADLPTPLLPPLGPDGKPIGPEMLAPVFPMNLIEQEVSAQRWIDIPEEILQILYRWRPAPLKRAVNLEKHRAIKVVLQAKSSLQTDISSILKNKTVLWDVSMRATP